MAAEIRPVKNDSDIDAICELEKENDQFIIVQSKEEHLSQINDDDFFYGLILSQDKKFNGYMILKGFTKSTAIEFKRVVIKEKNKGYGKEAIKWAMNMVLESGFHKIWLDVFVENIVAYKLYRSLGFRPEGISCDAIKKGDQYHDLIIMAHLWKEG